MPPSTRSHEREPLNYLCMTGAPFCGSTLLAFLLNAHPSCVSVGELTGPIERSNLDEYRCSCGARFVDCAFYHDVAERMGALGIPFDPHSTSWITRFCVSEVHPLNVLLIRSLLNDRLNLWRDRLVGSLPLLGRRVEARIDSAGRATWAFAKACLDRTGKIVFVDSSKDHQRPKWLFRTAGLDLRVIHLVKDVRAGSASFMKHFGIKDPAKAARMWRRANLEADRVLQQLPRERWLRIYYSDLCSDPQAELDRVAAFVGVPSAPIPKDYRAQEHHIIGNEMRLGGNGRIREDVSWQTRLSEADLDAIARVGGDANRYLGFEWPAARAVQGV